jgi:hypothetical protein
VRVAEGLEEIGGLGKAKLDPVLLKAVQILHRFFVRYPFTLDRSHVVLHVFDV